MPPPPSSSPYMEPAQELLADLADSAADFTRQLETIKAEHLDVITLSGALFDFVEDLTAVTRRARELRNAAFQASVRAATQLPAHELQAARNFSAAVVDAYRSETA